MSARTTINMLILIVSAAALGILLYIICNFKKVLNRMLQIGIGLVKENETKIQPIINDFSTSAVNNLLDNKSLISKSTGVVNDVFNSGNLTDALVSQTTQILGNDAVRAAIGGAIDSSEVHTAIGGVIDSSEVHAAIGGAINSSEVESALVSTMKKPKIRTALSNTIKEEPVIDAISNAILHALGGGDTNLMGSNKPTKFEAALINNLTQPDVSNAIGNAVSNYPQPQFGNDPATWTPRTSGEMPVWLDPTSPLRLPPGGISEQRGSNKTYSVRI
jgi:hypothetical protein